MQKLAISSVVLILFLAGGVYTLMVDEDGCPIHVKTVNLVANDGNPTGDSPGKPTTLSIKPDTIKVSEGCPFVIRNNQGHQIETIPEIVTDTWLKKGPVTTDLEVGPAECEDTCANSDDDFKYTLVVHGFGTLDPRARVR